MAPKLGELLVQKELLAPAQLEDALRAQVQNRGRLGTNLVELGLVTVEALASALAEQRALPAATPADFEAASDLVLATLPKPFAQEYRAFPLSLQGKWLKVAVLGRDEGQLGALRSITGLELIPQIAPELVLFFYLEKRYGITRLPRFAKWAPGVTASAAVPQGARPSGPEQPQAGAPAAAQPAPVPAAPQPTPEVKAAPPAKPEPVASDEVIDILEVAQESSHAVPEHLPVIEAVSISQIPTKNPAGQPVLVPQPTSSTDPSEVRTQPNAPAPDLKPIAVARSRPIIDRIRGAPPEEAAPSELPSLEATREIPASAPQAPSAPAVPAPQEAAAAPPSTGAAQPAQPAASTGDKAAVDAELVGSRYHRTAIIGKSPKAGSPRSGRGFLIGFAACAALALAAYAILPSAAPGTAQSLAAGLLPHPVAPREAASPPAPAPEPAKAAPAKVAAEIALRAEDVEGKVERLSLLGVWGPLAHGDAVLQGEQVRTGPGARAALAPNSGPVLIALDELSHVAVREASSARLRVRLSSGIAHLNPAGPGASFEVESRSGEQRLEGQGRASALASGERLSAFAVEGPLTARSGEKSVAIAEGRLLVSLEAPTREKPQKLELELDAPKPQGGGKAATLSGRVSGAPARVFIGDEAVDVDADGHFAARVDLRPGKNVFEAVAQDVAGGRAAVKFEPIEGAAARAAPAAAKKPKPASNEGIRWGSP